MSVSRDRMIEYFHSCRLLDMDSGGAVEIEEFLMGCLRLRGNVPRSERI